MEWNYVTEWDHLYNYSSIDLLNIRLRLAHCVDFEHIKIDRRNKKISELNKKIYRLDNILDNIRIKMLNNENTLFLETKRNKITKRLDRIELEINNFNKEIITSQENINTHLQKIEFIENIIFAIDR